MKKIVLLAMLALSLFATKANKSDNPFPGCEPCPFVR